MRRRATSFKGGVMGQIYCATNLITGKRYIGKTIHSFLVRKDGHEKAALDGAEFVFSRAIRKYGFEVFEWSVLFDGLEEDELNDYEIIAIKKWNTKVPNGYNMTDGGEGGSGYVFTDEQKKSISIALKGKPKSEETKRKLSLAQTGHEITQAMLEGYEKISNSNSGRVKTEEERAKLSASLKDKPKSKEHKEKISQALKGRTKGKTYEEMYGLEKAIALKVQRRMSILGRKHSESAKKKMSEARKGVSWVQMYGEEGAERQRKIHSVALLTSEVFQVAVRSPERGAKISKAFAARKA